MISNSEIPRPIMMGALDEVYRVAESLYQMSGGIVPDGCSFSRSLGELAEYCYSCAVVTFYNMVAREQRA